MRHIYFMGGSPCSGKSTMAEMLSKKHGFQYYKADDYLEKYIQKGLSDGDEWLKYIASMSMDALWLREPSILNEEELRTYEKLFAYFISDLEGLCNDIPVIAEGAAFLPILVNGINIDKSHYICVISTREFQLEHYRKRLWINEYLTECSDKEKAFDNWMERDALFALSVIKQSKEIGYETLIVDGKKNIDENLRFVEKFFCL